MSLLLNRLIKKTTRIIFGKELWILKTKIQWNEFLFYILILFLPLGLRKFVFGDGGEFSSFFIYFTDFIILGLLVACPKPNVRLWRTFGFALRLFLLTALIAVALSGFSIFSFLHFLEIALLILLFLVVRRLKINRRYLVIVIAVALILQSVLAIGQFALQRDCGLQILGEARLSPLLSGVAKIDWQGLKIVRAYGTFPHPNVLAAFLIFGLLLLSMPETERPPRADVRFLGIVLADVGFPLGIVALFLTFSRAAIIIGILSILAYLIFKKSWNYFWVFLLLVLVLTVILHPLLLERFKFNDSGINLRLDLQNYARQIIWQKPLFGVGPGNFTQSLRQISAGAEQWMIQPVHNLYLLIASETGILGILFFGWFLLSLLKRNIKKPKVLLAISFLILALFDHYFWTFQQGQLIFWISMGIIGNKSFLSSL